MDSKPDKRAGFVLKTIGTRKGVGSVTSAIHMILLGTKYVSIPADGVSIRRIYLHNFFDRFEVAVYDCVAAFPYGHQVKMLDDKGLGYIEVGPVPEGNGEQLYYILIGDVAHGRGYVVPIETTHTVKRIA